MLERRFAEIRNESGRTLVGTAVRYGDIGRTRFGPETIRAGAFSESLAGADIILNVGHNRNKPLARSGAGLSLRDAPDSLSVRAVLPRTAAADDALELVRSGVFRGLSVEMHVQEESRESGVRVVQRAALVGLGVVDRPAYSQSEIEARRVGATGGSAELLGTSLKSLIPYGRKLQCQCQRGDCGEVRFDAGSFNVTLASDREVLAVVGGYSGPLASRSAGTLRLRPRKAGLEVEITGLPDTGAARDLLASAASVPIFARPYFDQDASDFTESDGVATYTSVVLRSIIVGATDADAGWDEVVITDATPPTARRHLWL